MSEFDRHIYCKPNHHKHCQCEVNESRSFTGDFRLTCGSFLKIFESDKPVEINMNVNLKEQFPSQDLCDLKVKVELQNGDELIFDISNPNISSSSSEENSISFYSEDTLKVTLECQSGSTIGCLGFWSYTIILRGSEKDCKCECPVNSLIGRGGDFRLACGDSMKIFESNKPTEMMMRVSAFDISNQDPCDLKVKVELQNGDELIFDVPNPNLLSSSSYENSISFYSKRIRKVSVECQSGTAIGCIGRWFYNIILRGSSAD